MAKKKTTEAAVEALKAEAATDEDGLTIKQSRFVHAYLETGNASEAYRRAYNAENMSPEAIYVEACRLLQHPKVSLKVDALRRRIEDAAVLDRAWVLKRLMRNARIAMGEETVRLRMKVPAKGESPETVLEYELSDRDASAANKALELLGKTAELALWIDRKEVGGPGEFDRMSDEELRQFVAEESKALGIAKTQRKETKH